MPRNANRKDANTGEIMIAILESGWRYVDIHDCGHGVPDCIAYKFFEHVPISVLIEIKTDKGRLTSAEIAFSEKHDGLVHICRSADDVHRLLKKYDRRFGRRVK